MHNKEHEHKNVYVCEGTCGAKLTEEEYAAHDSKVCGTEGCTHKGQPFVKKERCEECGGGLQPE